MELAAIGVGPTCISGELLLAEILGWRAWIGTIVTSRAHSIVDDATQTLPGADAPQAKLDGDALLDIGHESLRRLPSIAV